MVDADIENLARDPAVEQWIADMDRDGVPIQDQIDRLTAYFREDKSAVHAAE